MESGISKGVHEALFKEGDLAEAMYIIKRGQVLCLKHSKDRLIPIFKAGAGDIIGESAMKDLAAHGYSAITLTSVELVEIPSLSFKDIFANSPNWLLDLTTTMIQRFENTARLVAENRVFHSSIISEEEFPSLLEIQIKKLLA